MILAFIIAFILSRALFAAVGFQYRVFRDPFNPVKLAIDLGVWIALYLAALWGLNRVFDRR